MRYKLYTNVSDFTGNRTVPSMHNSNAARVPSPTVLYRIVKYEYSYCKVLYLPYYRIEPTTVPTVLRFPLLTVLPTTYYLLPTTCYYLIPTTRLLPTVLPPAYCLLPITCYILNTTYYLLPTTIPAIPTCYILYLLPTTCYQLLPTTFCTTVPATSYLLPTTF